MPSPSGGFLHWLGRQIGHVKKAVETDVTPTSPPAPPATPPGDKVLYRADKIEEREVPGQPGIKLRRTVIDEVVAEPDQEKR